MFKEVHRDVMMGIGDHDTAYLLTGVEAKQQNAMNDTRWMGGNIDPYVDPRWQEVYQKMVPKIGPWLWESESEGPGNAQHLYNDAQKQRFGEVQELLFSAREALPEGVELKFDVTNKSVREVLEASGWIRPFASPLHWAAFVVVGAVASESPRPTTAAT